MRRVLVVGANGSGKSTFARELAKVTGLPLTHLDQVFWQSGWKPSQQVEFDTKLQALCAESAWILDGNFPRTLEMRASYADTIIFLDLPFYQCCWQLFKRRFQYRKRTRPDVAEGCPERFDLRLIQSLCRFLWFDRSRLIEVATMGTNEFHQLGSTSEKVCFLRNLN